MYGMLWYAMVYMDEFGEPNVVYIIKLYNVCTYCYIHRMYTIWTLMIQLATFLFQGILCKPKITNPKMMEMENWQKGVSQSWKNPMYHTTCTAFSIQTSLSTNNHGKKLDVWSHCVQLSVVEFRFRWLQMYLVRGPVLFCEEKSS